MRSTFKVLFYLKRNKEKTQSAVPVMGRITVNGTISQFSAKLTVPERLWEVRGGRAKGRSLEADRINRYLDDIRSQIDRHYRDIRDRESYVTAEKVKNAWLGFGKRYRTLLETFRSFTDDLHGRIGVDRSKNTWYRYLATMKHLQAFLTAKYRVSDIALAELELSFIEQFHVYLKTERALKLTSICRYLDCLINVVKIAFNDGIMPRNPFASYRYNEPTPERAFLNEEEILTLQHAALRTKKQRLIRDLSLFSCFTGICYADMKSLAWKQGDLANDRPGSGDAQGEAGRTLRGIGSRCAGLPGTRGQGFPSRPGKRGVGPQIPERLYCFVEPVFLLPPAIAELVSPSCFACRTLRSRQASGRRYK